jgi:hypothetical protein
VVEIRKRAERRLGEIMDMLRKAGMLAKPGDHRKRVSEKPVPLTLAKQGVDKHLADRARNGRPDPPLRLWRSPGAPDINGALTLARAGLRGSRAAPRSYDLVHHSVRRRVVGKPL